MRDISQFSTYESGAMQSTAHRILTRIKTDFLAQYDLTPTQWFVIGFTYDAGESGIRLNHLMELLDTTMPFITTTVNLLEVKGILQKVSDTDDSRVKIARLNPGYRKQVEKIESGLRDELRTKLYAAAGVNRQELTDYIAVLYKITKTND